MLGSSFRNSGLEGCLCWIPVPLTGWSLRCWQVGVLESSAQNGTITWENVSTHKWSWRKPECWYPRVLGLGVRMLHSWESGNLESGSLDFLTGRLRTVECWNAVLKYWNSGMPGSSRVGMGAPREMEMLLES